jgi:hypothetical protein
MSGSPHPRRGPWRPIAVLSVFTFISALGFSQAPAPADPGQAVLLDGSTDGSAVFHVALTSNGVQFSIVIPPDQCPDTGHVPQSGLFRASPQAAGVYRSGQSDGKDLVALPPIMAETLPVNTSWHFGQRAWRPAAAALSLSLAPQAHLTVILSKSALSIVGSFRGLTGEMPRLEAFYRVGYRCSPRTGCPWGVGVQGL